MKRLLLFGLTMMAICQVAFPHDFSVAAPSGQTLYYAFDSNGTVYVTYPSGLSYSSGSYVSGNLIIPSTVSYSGNTYSVTSIGMSAFYHCEGLLSVTIPNSVTSIERHAFIYCYNLATVTLPNSVTSIGEWAFRDCSMTSPVYNNTIFARMPKTYVGDYSIPSGITTICDGAFDDCTGLTSVTIPNTVTSVGDWAFYGCSGLTSFVLPNSVTSIGDWAFYGCSGLTSFVLPNSVTSIGDYAFFGCSGLTSFVLPNSVTSIGDHPFYGCNNITTIVYNNTFFARMPTSYSGLYIIPSGITTICSGAFYDCSGLISITIPNSVTSIGGAAFSGCSGLTSVTIPNSVTSIGAGAFRNCSGLTSVTIPNSVTSIEGYTFYDCSGLTSVTIPDSVTSIGNYAFSNCSGLTSVTIPNSVTSIGDEAFSSCSGLDTVYMKPSTPPTLGSDAFSSDATNRVFILVSCPHDGYYTANSWTLYQSALRDPVIDIEINLVANDALRGHAIIIPTAGNSDIACDSTAVIQATANYGYYFSQWNDGDTNNPRTVMLTQDTSFTAVFAPNQYTLTVATGEHGTANGSGTYNYGDTITIQATPEDHYHFIRWNDGNTENPRQYRIEDNITLTAFFAIDTYTVVVVSSDIIRGMVEASGTEFVYGTPCTVTATAYTGYTFAGWSNGVTANPYTFAVISDVELTALFVEEGEEVYTVTVESADPTMGTVSGGGQALNGGTVIITAIPNEGYRFLTWNDGNTENPRTVTVTGNIAYTAYFESTQGIGDIDATEIKIYTTGGRIVVQGAEGMEKRVYNLTGREVARPNQNGETPVLPSGVYLVKVGMLPARKVVVMR